mmetsp:Transcript_35178/g.78158  ORF Transcript_35178/g.78158 Transcript_35178/m.78158 type:complete len:412 (+) Transcript_35178:82-1317(+)
MDKTILPSPAPAMRGSGGPASSSRGIQPSSAPLQRGMPVASASAPLLPPTPESIGESPKVSHHSSRSRSGRDPGHQQNKAEAKKGVLVRAASISLKSFFAAPSPEPKQTSPEETSPEPKPGQINKSQKKIVNVLLVWSKFTACLRTLTLARSFHLWRFTSFTEVDDSAERRIKETRDHKVSYLALFAEVELLREQLSQNRKSALTTERAVRNAAVRTIVKVIFRSRLTAKQRYYFDIWLATSQMMLLIATNKKRSMRLEVGLQTLQTERAYVQNIESVNEKLKLTLAMTVLLHEWKRRAAQASITKERQKYDMQRKLMFEQMLRIRRLVSAANKREAAKMRDALHRGDEVSQAVQALSERLGKIASNASNVSVRSSSSGGGGGSSSDRATARTPPGAGGGSAASSSRVIAT